MFADVGNVSPWRSSLITPSYWFKESDDSTYICSEILLTFHLRKRCTLHCCWEAGGEPEAGEAGLPSSCRPVSVLSVSVPLSCALDSLEKKESPSLLFLAFQVFLLSTGELLPVNMIV